MLTRTRRTARFYYLKLIRLRGEPEYLARGVAIGVFIGVTPTIPLHTVLILGTALILRGSKISSILASWLVSNPLTFFAQYYLSWRLGDLLLPGSLRWGRIEAILQSINDGDAALEILHQIAAVGSKAIFSMVLGGCLLALPFTVAGYYFSLNLFRKFEERRRERQARREERESSS